MIIFEVCGVRNSRKFFSLDGDTSLRVSDIISTQNITPLVQTGGCFYLVRNGVILSPSDDIVDNDVVRVVPRLVGGKGGFGSMLRAIGAQIEKTTNREACRDLSGRRLRDINNEKRLEEWVAKKAEREQARQEKRQAKLRRLAEGSRHVFTDPEYDRQKKKAVDNVDDALQQGLRNHENIIKKRKQPGQVDEAPPAKCAQWMGVDEADLSDSSDSDSPSDSFEPDWISDNEAEPSTNESRGADDAGPSLVSCSSDTKQDDILTQQSEVLPTECTPAPVETLVAVEGSSQPTEPSPSECTPDTHTVPDTPVPTPADTLTTVEGACKQTEQFNLDEYTSVSELEVLGLDFLKSVLKQRDLKCGGTLQERSQRLLSVKGLTWATIPAHIRAGGKAKRK